MAAIDNAQNQNMLAQFTISQARRKDDMENALGAAARGAVDDKGNFDYAKYMTNAARGPAASHVPAIDAARMKSREDAAKAAKEEADLYAKEMANYKTLADRPEFQSPEGWLQLELSTHRNPVLGPRLAAAGITPEMTKQAIYDALQNDPEGTKFEKMKYVAKDGIAKFLEANKPTLTPQEFGDRRRLIATPGLGGPATVVQGSEGTINQSPDSKATANTAAAGLPLRAIQVDPLGITGAQDAYPLLPNTASGKTASIAPEAKFTPQELAVIQADAVKNATPAASAPTLGGRLTLKQAAQQGLRGNDFLGAMPAMLAGQVAAIVDHRAPPPLRNTARGDQLMQLVQQTDPTYDATTYGTKVGIEKAFASGRAGDAVRSFNVVQDHISTLRQAGDALANNDIQALNKIGNTIAQWTGEAAPTDFQAVKRIVAGEITKAVIGAAGALGDRNAVDQALANVNSPAQLKGVLDRYQQLIKGQLDGYRQQYKAGGGAKDFDKDILGTKGAATPNIDALLDKYK